MATPARRRYHPSSPFQAEPTTPDEVYVLGARVCHDAYGLGHVIGVQGTQAVQVDFGSGSVHVPLPCSRMSNL